jgi:hypothetical protein
MHKKPGSESTARGILESRTISTKAKVQRELGIDDRVARKQLQPMIERTSHRIIRKPTETKATKRDVGLQEVEDWMFWKPTLRNFSCLI